MSLFADLALDYLSKESDGHRLILAGLGGFPIRRRRRSCWHLVEYFRVALVAGEYTPEDLYSCFGGRVPIFTAEGDVDPFWRATFDSMPQQIGVSAGKGSHRLGHSLAQAFFNRAWIDCMGVARFWGEHLDPDDLPMVEAASVRANGGPWSISYRLRGADGKYRRFHSSVIPHFDADGRLAGSIGWNVPAPVAPPWDLYCSDGEFQWVLAECKSTTSFSAAL
jgi:PAS domain-containing protein